MKIWLGGEIESHVINVFRPIRNWVEQTFNQFIDNSKILFSIEKIRIYFIIRTVPGKESCKYNTKENIAEIVLNINPELFLNASDVEQRKIIFDKLILAINRVTDKVVEDLNPLKKLLKEFDEEYIMPPFIKESLNRLEEKISNIKKAGIEIEKPLAWSFFFFSKEKEDFLDLLKEIEGTSYVIDYNMMDDEGEVYWRLKLTKIEKLEVEKLNRRNIYFRELADYCQVHYDGWEVDLG